MKKHIKLLLSLAMSVTFCVAFSQAQDGGDHGHGHDHEAVRVAAPNGGRVVTVVDPAFEFFVAEDGKAIITFLDDSGAAVPPAEQEVTLIGGDRSNPTTLNFARVGDRLVSDKALPMDKTIPVVLQVTATRGGKVVRERFSLNFSECPTCEFAEYACACHD